LEAWEALAVKRRAFITLLGDPKWEEAGMLMNQTSAKGGGLQC
jgi:hypothetical protein